MSVTVTWDPFTPGLGSARVDLTDVNHPPRDVPQVLFQPDGQGRVDVLTVSCNLYMFDMPAALQEVRFDLFFPSFRVFHGGMQDKPGGAGSVSRVQYPERSLNFQGPIGEELNFVWAPFPLVFPAIFYGTITVQAIIRQED